ncbi:MAG: IS110 family transposase [Planctomycetes bacterium]|nr:IS110 family transposase [Planctomycetota bacterium]MCB9889299.1 IS110 family transposase [Planctomycetota bacterium]
MDKYRTVVIADHHKSVFVCRTVDTQTGETELRTLNATREELQALFTELPRPAVLFVEACRSWEWVSDLCEDQVMDMRLVDAAKMPEIWRSNKKTDRQDVEAMLERWLVTGQLPESYRATRAQRELRGLTRRLEEIRKHRRVTLNRIHALIDAHGMPAKKENFVDETWKASAQRLLPPDVWIVLDTLLDELGILIKQQQTLEQRVEELMTDHDDAKRLQAIPGVGKIIAATILAETADIERFPNARAFAAYTGLVPRVRSSAGKAKLGNITRSGPPGLRWALGHAIFASIRSKHPSAATEFYRLKAKRGKPKKLAMTAAAHKLARIVFVMLSRSEAFRPPRTRQPVSAKVA